MIRDSVDVVAVLGGHKELSNALNVPWRTVYNWTRPERRIPADMWHHVAAVPRRERRHYHGGARFVALQPTIKAPSGPQAIFSTLKPMLPRRGS